MRPERNSMKEILRSFLIGIPWLCVLIMLIWLYMQWHYAGEFAFYVVGAAAFMLISFGVGNFLWTIFKRK